MHWFSLVMSGLMLVAVGCGRSTPEATSAAPTPETLVSCDTNLYRSGLDAFDAGNYEMAVSSLNSFLSICPDLAKESNTFSYSFFMLGYSYEKLFEGGTDTGMGPVWKQRATENFARYLKLKRHQKYRVRAYAGLTSLLAQEKPGEARKTVDQGLFEYPDSAVLLRMKGNVLLGLGQKKEAESAYRAAIGLDPLNTWSWTGLGTALVQNGKFTEAGQAYSKALEIDSSNGVAHRSLDWLKQQPSN